ncbi:MAG TPA: 16S rRNA (cytosine(1402)-N(4))-methyltransferase RsmH [Candidatus Desulfofervidus auxilii]|uniref:Ribosomal RNA small subunit methyltransferase H n=1 Tax=Desulfofervidus auxilii TaxID=1621989 RepID=A0A7C0U262_DESA2|nr:16S rRNA (cytosine(1402)-N(4))-methyltransferase RsmH [Candidatus Desulfofervidus auxilii]
MEETIHIPVLKEEVLNYLACGAKKIFVDGTVGGGGHAKAILEASKPNGFLIGLDVDDEALVVAEKNLDNYRGRFILKKSNYAEMAKILMELGFEKVNGILLDLGLSSLQLGTPQRGFSFLQTGPLDMRMDKSNSLTAAQIVNHWPEFRLREIIKEFGEEKWAVRIAKKIIEYRNKKPIETTTQLAEIIANAIPKKYWPKRIHPATRTFQALRIVVNNELENLKQFLNQALNLIISGGRLVIISFHSLEDRIVKTTFRIWAKEKKAKILTKKPVRPSEKEIAINPRSRSAKLRAIEII